MPKSMESLSIEVEFGVGCAFTVTAGTAAGDPPVSAALSGTGEATGAGTPDGEYQFNGDCFFNCPGGAADDSAADEAEDLEASDATNTAINSSDASDVDVGSPLEMEFGEEGGILEIDMSEVEVPAADVGAEAPGEMPEGEASEEGGGSEGSSENGDKKGKGKSPK